MCGIAGKLARNGRVEESLLERMCQVLRHRGPDARGVFIDRGVGLGVQRLAIIDLETGDQPIFSEDGSVVVVLNGEIYNFLELRRQLQARGHTFSTKGDTEVIVHLYEEHGEDCVLHLRGMFAFALWDARRERLLLARDRVGKKPLFYCARDGELWFASEPKAIFQDPAVPRDVDFAAIDAFLHYQYIPDPRSAFASLRKLPPGHLLTWEAGEVSGPRRYWKLSYQPKLELGEQETHELIRDTLVEATRLRLRSDVPVGALLSGGVDSSAVVAAMAHTASGRIKTFSIGFDSAGFDETAYAREVAALFDTDHHELRVRPAAIEVLPRLVWHYGEPFADHSAIPSFALAQITRRQVTVALNGDGGDESFGGYPRYVVSERAHRFDWVPSDFWRAGADMLARLGVPLNTSARASRLLRALNLMSQEPWARYANYVAYFKSDQRRRLYRPEFARELTEADALSVIRGPYRASDAEHFTERLVDVDFQTYLPGDLLVKMDIASMAHSLEVRSPLLDQRLVEMAARLPKRAKIRGGVTKHIFKDSLRAWLPAHILDRKKMGFAVPIAGWFRGPLRSLPGEVLLDPRSLERGMFREQELRVLIDDHIAGRANHANRLWALLQLELWLRTYIDPGRPAPVTLDSGSAPALAPV